MSKEQKVQEEARSPFDVTGPSVIGAALEKGRKTSLRLARDETKAYYNGWSIGKVDENKKFNAINRSQFGTRERKKK